MRAVQPASPEGIGSAEPALDTLQATPTGAGGKVKPERSDRRTQQAELPDSRRQPLLFAREDWSLYTSLATLPQRAGVAASALPWLVAKELCDNALDAADAAGRPGAVEIGVDPRQPDCRRPGHRNTGSHAGADRRPVLCRPPDASAANCCADPAGAPSATGCASALATLPRPEAGWSSRPATSGSNWRPRSTAPAASSAATRSSRSRA